MTLVNSCPGVPLIRDPDDVLAVFSKYPWTCHSLTGQPLGFCFPTANYDSDEIVGFDIHSTLCDGQSEDGNACSACRKLTPKIDNLWLLSTQPPRQLNYQYQTHDQLTQGHRSKNQVICDLQLTMGVKCIHYHTCADNYVEYKSVAEFCHC